jgi:hypothetical protein
MQRPGPSGVPLQDADGPRQRVLVDAARPVDALSYPGDLHVAGQLQKPAALAAFGHDQPDGIRSEIDGSSPRSLLVHRLDAAGHPRPDGVVRTSDVVRVVRVQALHAHPRAADAAPAPGFRQLVRSVLSVLAMDALEPPRELDLKPVDPSLRLERRDRAIGVPAREPVQRREGPAFGVERVVTDDERMSH